MHVGTKKEKKDKNTLFIVVISNDMHARIVHAYTYSIRTYIKNHSLIHFSFFEYNISLDLGLSHELRYTCSALCCVALCRCYVKLSLIQNFFKHTKKQRKRERKKLNQIFEHVLTTTCRMCLLPPKYTKKKKKEKIHFFKHWLHFIEWYTNELGKKNLTTKEEHTQKCTEARV